MISNDMYPSYLFPVVGLSGQALSATTSSTVTFSAFPTAQYVEVSVNTAPVAVTFDGSVPSATNGLVIPNGLAPTIWTIDKALAAKFRSTSGTAVVYGAPQVSYQAEQTYVRSLSAELLNTVYPVNHGF